MSEYMTIDGGTTNTRVAFVRDGGVLGQVAFAMGARHHRDDPTAYRGRLREAILQLAAQWGEFSAVLVSGMLTSEMGLLPLTHLVAPIGVQELHDGMQKTYIEDITDKPFYFIPGVKTVGESYLDVDMMRGEEAELMGLLGEGEGEVLFVLPGSHSKLISVDAAGRISRITTMLTGEMAAALSGHTILSDSVALGDALDEEALLAGYRCALERGLNEALFKVRVMHTQKGKLPPERYGFFLGCVLCGEVEQIRAHQAPTVMVAGQKQLKRALCRLLEEVCAKRVIAVEDAVAAGAVARGQIKIFEYGGRS